MRRSIIAQTLAFAGPMQHMLRKPVLDGQPEADERIKVTAQ